MSSRILERPPYGEDGVEDFVLPQLIGRSLLMKPTGGTRRRDISYQMAEDFWRDVLEERLVAERVVTLEAMRVFEWFPRNPGLFHTARAQQARELARYHILDYGRGDYEKYVKNADARPDHASLIRTVTRSDAAAEGMIFTPKGKMSMLQGGIGCVRYKSVDKASGDQAWFMSAASGFAPDEGIPLLVPDQIYQSLIDAIKEVGFAPATLRGRVRFIPDQFRDLYSARYRIPRLYVDVEEVKRSEEAADGYGEVSVAASFVAEIEGEAGLFAAYVTFDPGYAGARGSAIEWMEEEYVRGLYKGEVVTDFDQQSPAFSDTLFSLDDVMKSPDLASLILNLKALHGHFDWSMLERQNINFSVDRRDMRMKVHIGGDAKNVVIGGHGSNNSLVISQSQLQELTEQLGKARLAVKKEPDSDERDRMIGALADAEEAAKNADQDGIGSALRRLKPFKDKAIDILEKVGVGLAVAAIKAAVGV